MRPHTLAALALVSSAALSGPAGAAGAAGAADASADHKIIVDIVALDAASGTLQLSNGLVLNRTNFIQSAAFQRLYETEGADQLQRKLRGTAVRYIASDAKA